MKATRIAYSKNLNAGKYAQLEEQARRLGRIRSEVWQRYGSISGIGVTDRQIRDQWLKEGRRDDVLVVAWQETLRDAKADIEMSVEAAIFSAHVSVTSLNKKEHDLGLALLDRPIELRPNNDHILTEQVSFQISLSPYQLAGIEEIRDGKDLEFKLIVKCKGGDEEYVNPSDSEWKVKVPQSEWIGKLKQAGYSEIMLLEVPMLPRGQVTDDWIDVKAHLEEAHDSFLNRKYTDCVSQCRKVMEEAGHLKFGKGNWYNPLLKLIGTGKRSNEKEKRNREDMSKEERENAIWASLFHYTHQANHGKSKGGESNYSREEAKLILTLTAAFIAR